MRKKIVTIKKRSGNLEPFSIQKLEKSLKICGATKQEIKKIVTIIIPELYDGISSEKIYKKAFSLLKKHDCVYASKYSLKKAIFDLGPTGYPFEKLISALLKQKGYTTKVGKILQGKCITHEIDVLAEKNGNTYAIECKFHLSTNAVSNVKVPLYVNSRFIDVQKHWNNSNKTTHLKQGWLVTNTRFTKDAINYGTCVGLTMLSWNYPKGNGISKNIDVYGLYPITTLTSLTKREKMLLIEKDIVLVTELLEAPNSLKKLNISPHKIHRVLNEVQTLCNM